MYYVQQNSNMNKRIHIQLIAELQKFSMAISEFFAPLRSISLRFVARKLRYHTLKNFLAFNNELNMNPRGSKI